MTAAFDAGALERRYAYIDDCPESLLHAVVTLPVGMLPERVAGLVQWRESLLAGRLPAPGWPPDEIAAPARRALEDTRLIRFCTAEPELVDALLVDVLASFARQTAVLRSEIAARLRELENLERVRFEMQQETEKLCGSKRPMPPRIDPERMLRQVEIEVASRSREPDGEIVAAWGERARAWSAIADVFGDLGQMLGRGWDLARGVLRHAGWLDLLRLRKLVEELPQIHRTVRALGRLQASDLEESAAETLFVAVRRLEEERRQLRTPEAPAETRGVTRSGEIARMLPFEALMLGHPKLRLLWHARRAERALLTYRVEGVEIERAMVESEGLVEVVGRRPRPQRGPILAVIDTSGSMHGLPEQLAKAIVLECARTAHAERRRCFLYAYGGPGDLIEHELDLAPEGMGRLLVFLLQTFGGGTDIGAMSTVVQRLRHDSWKKADVLLVSDGEWRAASDVRAAVRKAKQDGTRFHGVQIGNRGRTGLHDICDPVHVFQDWASAGGWAR